MTWLPVQWELAPLASCNYLSACEGVLAPYCRGNSIKFSAHTMYASNKMV